jgi:hypothetical protein
MTSDSQQDPAGPKPEKEKRPGRWPRAFIIACIVVVSALIALMTVAKVYAYVMPAPPKDWNASQLVQINAAYGAQKKEYYDTGDPSNMEGYSLAIFGDVHNSVYTFDKLIRRINQTNVKVDATIAKLEARLATARKAQGTTPEAGDKAVLALEKKINETRKSKILFAVANGDLTISGNEVQYRMFFEQVRKLKVPLVTTPGNHDARASASDVYRQIFGPRYYAFPVGVDYFIMLDDADQVRIGPAQMKWFEEELKKSEKYRYCNVFMHVPAFKGHRDQVDKGVTIPWTRYLKDRKNALAFRKLCEKYDVNFVIGSHLHTFDFDVWDMSGSHVADNDTMARNEDDGLVWTIISGGAGAQLWKTYDWRAHYHYFVGKINGEFPVYDSPGETHTGIQFDKIQIVSRHGEQRYFLEKVYVYAFTDIVNNYLWLMMFWVPVLALLIYALVRKKRHRGQAAI